MQPQHHRIAEEAINSAKLYVGILSREVVLKLQLAYVAQWLANQDHENLPRAGQVAASAVDWLHVLDSNQ